MSRENFGLQVIFFAMFVATIVKKPEHQGLNSVDAREIKEVEQKMVDLCAENIGKDSRMFKKLPNQLTFNLINCHI